MVMMHGSHETKAVMRQLDGAKNLREERLASGDILCFEAKRAEERFFSFPFF